MSIITTVPNGRAINLESLPQTLVYNADGTVNYTSVIDGGKSFRQTFTYTLGLLVAVSAWVEQE